MIRIFLAVLCMLPQLGFASYKDLDPKTCEPDGIFAKLREKSDPRSFWAKAHTSTSELLEFYTKGNPESDAPHTASDCKIFYRNDPQEMQACLWRIENLLSSVYRCHIHSQRMCRLSGGYC